jgi:hypothetical protein
MIVVPLDSSIIIGALVCFMAGCAFGFLAARAMK